MEEMPSKEELRRLAYKWKTGTLTEEEADRLAQWDQAQRDEIMELSDDSEGPDAVRDRMYAHVLASINPNQRPAIRRLMPLIAIAASILLALAAILYFYIKSKPATDQIVKVENDLKPGTNGAILTLANGKKIVLEKTRVGAIASGINKSNDSLLTYNQPEEIGQNILETPKGHQYSVVLPDGTKVWLNAASSLKYPTKFVSERIVELTGEAYFEVVHNVHMPFKVKTNNQLTEDIGTRFNISAYNDEPATATTLVEGSVKVNEQLLKPGYTAISPVSTTTNVKRADIDQVIAWKNGAFSFEKTPVPVMMRQIARWYDVEVAYEGEIPNKTITGEVHRNVNASQALQILSYLNIHYRIEGKKIIITK
ncbi:DUF4974 domain-containing protein [Mucilaginibacter corticis]|uniref:DUF4974 domain-containing protein n=1 Tax=Mucilaginibacter corticis TaxID=2597670 RepID=A0A556M9J8_9SPHI|nr:FecR family protein [Mucilaginibacter corticis]TSJ36580.1 DUF4974 domain-containing protein [Mucilaginibacter corticis]